MTVCVASLLQTPEQGKAIITASDRMITGSNGEIEYEPLQTKIAHINKRTVILIAGEIELHSEAIMKTMRQVQATQEADVETIAEIYGSFLRAITRRYAEQTYLSQWGLTTETFLQRQQEFSPDFVAALSTQIDSYPIPQTSAIVAGCDDTSAYLYHVDGVGRVKCHTDIGFIAIGSGAHHAESRFMEARYSNVYPYIVSLILTYAAKKKAEIAPGVGTETDMIYIGREGWSPIIPEYMVKVTEMYKAYEEKKKKLEEEAVIEFQKFMKENAEKTKPKDEPKGSDKQK